MYTDCLDSYLTARLPDIFLPVFLPDFLPTCLTTCLPASLIRAMMNYTEDDEESNYDRGPPSYSLPPQQLEVLVRFLSFYWTPFISFAGLVSNTFCIVILSHSVASLSTWLLYVTGFVVAETLHLATRLDRWAANLGLDLYGRVGGWCQLVTFLSDSAEFLALWYAVCLGTDRVLHHLDPSFRVTKVATSLSSARTALVLLSTVAIIIYINTSITFGEVKYENLPMICSPLQMFEAVVFRLHITGAFINSILPLFLLSASELFLGITLVLKKTPRDHFRLPQTTSAAAAGAQPITPRLPCSAAAVADDSGASSEETDNERTLANTEGDRCSFVLIGFFLLSNIPVHLVNDMDAIRSLFAGRNQEPELTKYLVQRTLEELQAANEAIILALLAATSGIFRQGLSRTMAAIWRRRGLTLDQPNGIEFSV